MTIVVDNSFVPQSLELEPNSTFSKWPNPNEYSPFQLGAELGEVFKLHRFTNLLAHFIMVLINNYGQLQLCEIVIN